MKLYKKYRYLLKSIYRFCFNIPYHYLLKKRFSHNLPLIELGSPACSYTILDDPNLINSSVISAGLGEDSSFEIELINKYSLKVICLDPTPTAIEHYNLISDNFGKKKLNPYNKFGKQNASCYNLEKINLNNFQLIKKALWTTQGIIKFYQPPNLKHTSYSITDYQNNFKKNTGYINVESINFKNLCKNHKIDLDKVFLIKLDIEGAEYEVIKDLLIGNIFKNLKQILVEFDELNLKSNSGFLRVNETHALLIEKSFTLVHTDHQANFLYISKNYENYNSIN